MWRHLLFVWIAALGLPGSLRAGNASGECIGPPAGMVLELLDWIGAASGYDVDGVPPPTIFFCDEGEELRYSGATVVVEPHDRGIYDPATRSVYLVRPWSPDDPEDVAVLLHELVHDVQFSNRTWECPNATETEAYTLHAAWLAERGIEAEIDWFKINVWSQCRRNPHP